MGETGMDQDEVIEEFARHLGGDPEHDAYEHMIDAAASDQDED